MKQKSIITIVFFIATGLICVTLSAILTMPYVSQKIGFKDVVSPDFTDKNCTDCHKGDVGKLHHDDGEPTGASNCTECHDFENNKNFCSDCHSASPHHESESAKSYQCAKCHNPKLVTNRLEKYHSTLHKAKVARSVCNNCHKAAMLSDGSKIDSTEDTHHSIELGNDAGCNILCHDLDKNKKDDFTCGHCHNSAVIHNVSDHEKACTSCHTEF